MSAADRPAHRRSSPGRAPPADRSPARIRRGSPACRRRAASSATGAREISSCSLVISRQIAASRVPMMPARSASVSCTRLPDSNITSVASIRDSSVSRARRAVRSRRQKSLEEKPVGRQRGHAQRRQHRGRAGQRDHGMAGGADLAHQLEAGIGNQRRAGIRHQRDRDALRQLLQDDGARLRGVVLVIGFQLRRDPVALGQPARHPCVFAGDDVDAGQGFQRAQRDVAEIADRRRHQMQAGNRLRRGQDMAAQRKCARRRFRQAVRRICGSGFWAHNANLEGTRRRRHKACARRPPWSCLVELPWTCHSPRKRWRNPGTGVGRRGHNPFDRLTIRRQYA